MRSQDCQFQHLRGHDGGFVDHLELVAVFARVLVVLDSFTVRSLPACHLAYELPHGRGAVAVVDVKLFQILHPTPQVFILAYGFLYATPNNYSQKPLSTGTYTPDKYTVHPKQL